MTHAIPTIDSASLLIDAADTITERGKQRDKPNGERSMGRCVRAFNAIYGTSLTEEQGWQFMALLKIARSGAGRVLRIDDYIDQAAYSALAGECAARTRPDELTVHHTAEHIPDIGAGAHPDHFITEQRIKAGHSL